MYEGYISLHRCITSTKILSDYCCICCTYIDYFILNLQLDCVSYNLFYRTIASFTYGLLKRKENAHKTPGINVDWVT